MDSRVGLIAPLPPQVGGVASFATWLLRHADELGVTYVTFDLKRPPEGEAGGRLTVTAAARQVRLLFDFYRWIGKSPTLVHFCVSTTRTGLPRDALVATMLALAGRRTIAHVHGYDVADACASPVRRQLLRIIGRMAVAVVGLSPASSSALNEIGIPAHSICNPIALEPLAPARRAINDEEPLQVLFVGALGRRKGCRDLIAAVESVRETGARVHVTFVGSEEYRGEEDYLRSEVERRALETQVRFVGKASSDTVRGWYERSDVLCLPSYKEGLPMVILEAMAHGLPVVVTPVGDIGTVVEDGRSGVIVEPGDVRAIGGVLSWLASERRHLQRLGDAAAARAVAIAGRTTIVGKWKEAYAAARGRTD